jgi:hypothetical protein
MNTLEALATEMDERGVGHTTASITVNRCGMRDTWVAHTHTRTAMHLYVHGGLSGAEGVAPVMGVLSARQGDPRGARHGLQWRDPHAGVSGGPVGCH